MSSGVAKASILSVQVLAALAFWIAMSASMIIFNAALLWLGEKVARRGRGETSDIRCGLPSGTSQCLASPATGDVKWFSR